jgi:hypothetical protein
LSPHIAAGKRTAGEAATITAIILAVLDEGVAIYEVAHGHMDVEQFVARTGKTILRRTAA